jgi:hypothetical protein
MSGESNHWNSRGIPTPPAVTGGLAPTTFGPCKIEAVANTPITAVQHRESPQSIQKDAFSGAFRRKPGAVCDWGKQRYL